MHIFRSLQILFTVGFILSSYSWALEITTCMPTDSSCSADLATKTDLVSDKKYKVAIEKCTFDGENACYSLGLRHRSLDIEAAKGYLLRGCELNDAKSCDLIADYGKKSFSLTQNEVLEYRKKACQNNTDYCKGYQDILRRQKTDRISLYRTIAVYIGILLITVIPFIVTKGAAYRSLLLLPFTLHFPPLLILVETNNNYGVEFAGSPWPFVIFLISYIWLYFQRGVQKRWTLLSASTYYLVGIPLWFSLQVISRLP